MMSNPVIMSFRRSFACLFIIPVLFVKFSEAAPSGSQNYEVCQTTRCREIANNLIQDMDVSVNPCDDFYQYMCGGFIKNNPIPDEQSHISKIFLLEDKIIDRLYDMLTGPPKHGAPRAFLSAQQLYRMCRDTDTRDRLGVTALANLVTDVGGWPIAMGPESSKTVQWQDTFQNIVRKLLPNGLVDISVSNDLKDSEKKMIFLYPPTFDLQRRVYMNASVHQEKISAYRKYIKGVAEIFAQAAGQTVSDDDIDRDVDDMLAFVTDLVNLTYIDDEEPFDVQKLSSITIDEFQQQYDEENPGATLGKIDWLSILRSMFSVAGVEINGSEKITVPSMTFMLKLSFVLDRASHRTIANYLQWSFINQILPYTGGKALEIRKQYMESKLGITGQEERWKQCIRIPSFLTAMSYEYVRRYLPREAKQESYRIVENVKEAVKNKIAQAKWMDEETRAVSIDKLVSIQSRVGYPDWFSKTAVDALYQGVNVTSQFFESILNLLIHDTLKKVKSLRETMESPKLLIEPVEVNAYYTDISNSMFITAGILQEPVFDPSRPTVMNYGGLGEIAGHEFSHAFDDSGRNFDKYGNAVQWWTNDTSEKYKDIAKCFVDQYNEYVEPHLLAINKTVHIDGKLTVSENIADSSGVKAAFTAYKRWSSTSGAGEIRLPGLERFSDDQLFFMTFGNVYCKNVRPEQAEINLSDAHPPRALRIRGSLSNTEEFSEAFDCPLGSPMNPAKKCSLF